MILKVLAVLVLLIVAILIFAATKPDIFHIQRSIQVQGPPEKIFPLINDFHNWPQWEPQDSDPVIKRTFDGAESGVGAMSDWSGAGRTGAGHMAITESAAPQSVTVDVEWKRPFAAHNINRFTLEPDGSATKVTWSMQGPNHYMMKLMSVFTNMDRMMGAHFDDGLAKMKAAAEK
jgi:carbon monoxide dehydrogenase subunit G